MTEFVLAFLLELAFNRHTLTLNYVTCRREGCSRRESLKMAVSSSSMGASIDFSLSERLEERMWIAEHPGCTKFDLDCYRDERLQDLIAEVRRLLLLADDRMRGASE